MLYQAQPECSAQQDRDLTQRAPTGSGKTTTQYPILDMLNRVEHNIIMFGEMRHLDTAQIAVGASSTGHLVLSTLHTNNTAWATHRKGM